MKQPVVIQDFEGSYDRILVMESVLKLIQNGRVPELRPLEDMIRHSAQYVDSIALVTHPDSPFNIMGAIGVITKNDVLTVAFYFVVEKYRSTGHAVFINLLNYLLDYQEESPPESFSIPCLIGDKFRFLNDFLRSVAFDSQVGPHCGGEGVTYYTIRRDSLEMKVRGQKKRNYA